jgi:hypothetical protein
VVVVVISGGVELALGRHESSNRETN